MDTAPERLSIRHLRFVLEHLVRPGEMESVVPSRTFQPTEEERRADVEAWECFLANRFALHQRLVLTLRESVPVAWLHAAIRLFGEDAAGVLEGFDRRDWPGVPGAEAALARRAGLSPGPGAGHPFAEGSSAWALGGAR